ncbi:MAG: MoaD/ThiS family protein [Desulfobacterales bacterium]|nr:MAG: MoaD/ThiS family protein [Desulfobacterales bacterium]
MQLKLTYGQKELLSHFPGADGVSVRQVMLSVKNDHPEIYERWCDVDGHLRETLNVFINGEHMRYRNGLESILNDGDEIYIVPLITGG